MFCLEVVTSFWWLIISVKSGVNQGSKFLNTSLDINIDIDVLRDLVPFAQFKRREKHS